VQDRLAQNSCELSLEERSSGTSLTAKTTKAYFNLTKPRITLLIAISTAVGFAYGTGTDFKWLAFINGVLGASLMASGAAALNQWYERESDAQMHRTKARPLPAGQILPKHALVFGVLLSLAGLGALVTFVNSFAGILGLGTSIAYLFVYTPLKRVGPICTTVGALPGAMPPLIGFAAASNHLNFEAWILFSILFLWQFPHFHAIAWLYREDYERAGIRMLAVVRPNGKALSFEIIMALILLAPVTLVPSLVHMTGSVYTVIAALLNAGFLFYGIQMCRNRTRFHARRLLLASVIYMPLLFAALVFDSPRWSLGG
jgi:heme o synthase